MDETATDLESYRLGWRARQAAERAAESQAARDLAPKLSAAARLLRSEFGATTVGVFGSFLTGMLRPDSDVDLFVDRIAEGRYFEAVVALEAMLGRSVDLVELRGAQQGVSQPGLRLHLEQEGQILP